MTTAKSYAFQIDTIMHFQTLLLFLNFWLGNGNFFRGKPMRCFKTWSAVIAFQIVFSFIRVWAKNWSCYTFSKPQLIFTNKPNFYKRTFSDKTYKALNFSMVWFNKICPEITFSCTISGIWFSQLRVLPESCKYYNFLKRCIFFTKRYFQWICLKTLIH